MGARFVQIHTLTHYPASLLNRDDAGFAKRMPFGGAVRTRISSQCLKRHWRVFDGEHSLREIEAPESVRSRVAFERFIVEPLIDRHKIDPAVARRATQRLVDTVLGSEAKRAKQAKRTGKGSAQPETEMVPESGKAPAGVVTEQVTVLGRPELDYLCQLTLDAINSVAGAPDKVESAVSDKLKDKHLKENIKALKPGSLWAGLGAALFGRMVTGDILARTDSAIHVAHAMTVHGQMAEADYFTALDDLIRDEGEQESGHINASELTSGLFYGYVVVDVRGLVGNLGGDRLLAGDVVKRLVQMIATVTPGAKKGSTAPYAYSHLVLVESGNSQPRTLQNAFIEPVRTGGDLVQNAYAALRGHLAELDMMYGKSVQRAHTGLFTGNGQGNDIFGGRMSLADLAQWANEQVRE